MINQTLLQYIEGEPEVPFFLKPSWMEVVCPGEWDVIALEKDGKLQAFIPIRLRKKWGFRIVTTPYLTPHSGPWFAEGVDSGLATAELARRLDAFNYVHLSLDPALPYSIGSNPYLQFSAEPTFVLSGSMDDIHAGLQKKLRQQLNQSKDAFTLEAIDTATFYALIAQSFRRQSSAVPFSRTLIERMVTQLRKHRWGDLIGAKDSSGEFLAATLYYEDQQWMYTMLSGQNYASEPRNAHKWLHYEIIKKAIGKQKSINFMGSKIPGVAFWNSYFGADIRYYFRVKKHPGVLLTRIDHWRTRWSFSG